MVGLKKVSALDLAESINARKEGVVVVDNCEEPVDERGDNDNDCLVKLRALFDQVLSIFINKAIAKGRERPIPVFLGDGKLVDLFDLFLAVIKRGGYEMMDGFWTFVVKELGLDCDAAASVKLSYVKYLRDLETWFMKGSRDGRLETRVLGSHGNVKLLASDLEAEFRNLLSHGCSEEVNGDEFALAKNANGGKYIGNSLGVDKSGAGLSGSGVIHGSRNAVLSGYLDDDGSCKNESNDLLASDYVVSNKVIKSRKRKRESISVMLKWLTNIARCPVEPSIGAIPPASKWNGHNASKLCSQVIRARNALALRHPTDSTTIRDPAKYDEIGNISNQSAEIMRCSKELPAFGNHPVRSFPQLEKSLNAPVSDDTFRPFKDEKPQMKVLVGSRFQAEVPEWTGMVVESDSKWLGTCQWPTEDGAKSATVERDDIGKGRPDVCDCRVPGSVGCVSFHTAEERMKLKLEIGQMFFRWRFNHMGEQVALRWTATEDKRFKDMVRLNIPCGGKCLWDYAQKYFPKKTTEDLVSYYFNVFVARHRSYQNRVTPNTIDSDDDITEFGGFTEDQGHEAEISSSGMIICSENKQSTDFDLKM